VNVTVKDKTLWEERRVVVTLSEANVLALLHKVNAEDSQRTIYKFTGDTLLVVKVEKDAEHYGETPRGVMREDTEQFIAVRQQSGGGCAPGCASTVDGECDC
jgi:hypothetical protein